MNFKLRKWNSNDLDSLVEYADNWEIAKNLTDKYPHPYTRVAGEQFIKFASSSSNHIYAIDINGVACGGIGLHPQEDIHRKNAELGYWLAEPFWGKGIMTEAVKLMIDYGFKNIDIDRIYAIPFGSNIGSQKVLEKLGFIGLRK